VTLGVTLSRRVRVCSPSRDCTRVALVSAAKVMRCTQCYLVPFTFLSYPHLVTPSISTPPLSVPPARYQRCRIHSVSVGSVASDVRQRLLAGPRPLVKLSTYVTRRPRASAFSLSRKPYLTAAALTIFPPTAVHHQNIVAWIFPDSNNAISESNIAVKSKKETHLLKLI